MQLYVFTPLHVSARLLRVPSWDIYRLMYPLGVSGTRENFNCLGKMQIVYSDMYWDSTWTQEQNSRIKERLNL